MCQSAGLASCFPGAARVALPGGATKPMSELSLGDSVLAVGPDGRLQYAAVVMFSSRRPSQRAPFMRIHTDAGLNITGGWLAGWLAGLIACQLVLDSGCWVASTRLKTCGASAGQLGLIAPLPLTLCH